MFSPAPTATESPRRFVSVRPARTICRPRSTASAHLGDGADCVTDGTSRASGCSGVAVTLTYTQSPRMAAGMRQTTPMISAIQNSVRRFDIVPLSSRSERRSYLYCRKLFVSSDGRRAFVLQFLRRDRSKQRDQRGDQCGPPGLMAGADAGAVVAVEVLIEQNEIPPVRIVLQLPDAAVHGTMPVRVG